LDDDEVLALLNEDLSFFGAASRLNVPPELLDFKFRVLKRKGYKIIDPPMRASSDFATFSKDGRLLPLSITWEDGREFIIDQVLDIRQAAAMKAGGQGDRYTVRVQGRDKYLFFERNAINGGNNIGRWFVERHNSN